MVPAALLLGLAFLVLLMGKSDKEKEAFAGKVTLGSALLEQAGELAQERVQTCFLPILTFMRAGQPGWSRQAAGIGEEAFLPLTHFLKKAMLLTEDSFTIDRMILAESEEGVERQREGQEEAFTEGEALEEDALMEQGKQREAFTEEGALEEDALMEQGKQRETSSEKGSLEEASLSEQGKQGDKENGGEKTEERTQEDGGINWKDQSVSDTEQEKEGKGTESQEGGEAATESGVLIREEWENGGQGVDQSDALLHTQKVKEIDWVEMADFDILVKNMYTIDSSTEIGSNQLNVEKLGSVDLRIDKESSGYQILIYHTHSQEAFLDSRPGVEEDTIVGVGDYLADILQERYGYRVLHHYGVYDVPSRDDAYSVALPDVTRVLEENPSIQVVIDLHRDAVDAGTRLVTEINGKQIARFMFFNGLSRTRKRGNISYLYNENLDANLAFSFQMEQKAMEYYPGLTRKIYLKAYRYNMHLRPRSLLVELGAQTNTLQEARNACEPLAQMLDMVLSGE